MIDTVQLPGRTFVLGEKKNIGLSNLRQSTGGTLSVTATVAIYDDADTVVLAATAMTITGTTRVKASYLLTTGTAMTITAAGDYRAEYTVTNGSEVQIFQESIEVKSKPF